MLMDKYRTNSFKDIKLKLNKKEEEGLFPKATFNSQAVRRYQDKQLKWGYRQAFALDADRILHSLAYTRYIDKTQVFYLIENDHITHRVLHVQLVSKIARTIGRFLGLNEDLIEAVALGHDIGHAPFGHDGESFLSKLCQENGIGFFHHNVQSVHFLDKLERKGKGWNLCLQTLDGILCHDGESHDQVLKPQKNKSFGTIKEEIKAKTKDIPKRLIPMTLEGCVVRMADTVAYIGRDIEDALRLSMIKRSDLPKGSVSIIGDTNGAIVYNLVTDIIENSYQKPYIALSPKVSEALLELKAFNYERIYLNPLIKKSTGLIKRLFEILFTRYLADVENKNLNSVIFTGFLNNMSLEYIENHKSAQIVRDFIAGMTDRFFLQQCPEDMRPGPIYIKGAWTK